MSFNFFKLKIGQTKVRFFIYSLCGRERANGVIAASGRMAIRPYDNCGRMAIRPYGERLFGRMRYARTYNFILVGDLKKFLKNFFRLKTKILVNPKVFCGKHPKIMKFSMAPVLNKELASWFYWYWGLGLMVKAPAPQGRRCGFKSRRPHKIKKTAVWPNGRGRRTRETQNLRVRIP